MANGDLAVSVGMTKVLSTAPRKLGYDEINLSRDNIVTFASRNGVLIDMWVQPAAPAHKAGRIWIQT